jgi:ADP-ribosylglycohydrolase/protein tyrosine phosphatase (PTP) superfamily phosphohydrolase (DUF442 family)
MPKTSIPDLEFDTIHPRLLAGRNPLTAADVEQLRESGVTHVLDLREAREWTAPWLGQEAGGAIEAAGMERLHVPVVDTRPPSGEDFDRAVEFLERVLAAPENVVYVHCRAGQERTGAVLAAYVGRRDGVGVDDAVTMLQRSRPVIHLLDDQWTAVERWLATPRAALGPGYRERVRGCLLAGAVGDALGAGIEFSPLDVIRRRFGAAGPDRYVGAYGSHGVITDDTQMTLFTAEGLIRAWVRGRTKGICDPPGVVHRAYLRWLHTQEPPHERQDVDDGWLIRERRLHASRAPGLTCLGALREKEVGTRARPINNSKGCGGVMRVAPVGLLRDRDRREVFELGADCAAITHGHPSGWVAAGALAVMVRELVAGEGMTEAAEAAVAEILRCAQDDNDPRILETVRAIEEAMALAAEGEPSAEKVESLAHAKPERGPGWVAEEALAVALYCSLVAPDMRSALRLAVTHTGDSDSTGAICGNLLGARDGEQAIPADWLADLELRDVIERLADDFAREMTDPPMSEHDDGSPPEEWWERYPGW